MHADLDRPEAPPARVFVRFTPRDIGPRAAELAFDANTAAGHHVVRLAGTGTAAPVATPTPVTPVPTTVPTPSPTATPKPAPKPSSVRVAIPFRSSFAPPPGLTRKKACSGKVTVQLRAGARTIATRTARLNRRCRYKVTFDIPRAAARGRSRLKIVARFHGNRYLAATRATYEVQVPAA